MKKMTSSLFTLKDRIVVVTGALGQLGSNYCQALMEAGAKVVGIDISRDAERLLKKSIFQKNRQFLFLSCDITKRSEVEISLHEIEKKWGCPDGLINNAALDSPPQSSAAENGPFEDYPESSWDSVMKVNVKGVFVCSQVFGGAMAKHGFGSIINISSIYGQVSPNQNLYEYRRKKGEIFFKPVAYSASKSSIYNLTRYLATYWAPKRVRVNTLTLGGVFNNQDPQFLNEYNKMVPLGRMAKADEYNGAVIFLLSNASSYMTGANLVVDGGWTAW